MNHKLCVESIFQNKTNKQNIPDHVTEVQNRCLMAKHLNNFKCVTKSQFKISQFNVQDVCLTTMIDAMTHIQDHLNTNGEHSS